MNNEEFRAYLGRCIALINEQISTEGKRAEAYDLIAENAPEPEKEGWRDSARRCRERIANELQQEVDELKNAIGQAALSAFDSPASNSK